MTKTRVAIPADTAARSLFLHDRTCCVCRQRGKPVQIHHINDDPGDNDDRNLAVLCFDCHRETQIRGGFDRKLDADQVTLYRDDWLRIVSRNRAQEEAWRELSESKVSPQLELATSVAEIYRDNRQYELLAIHYDSIGNIDLRDKYIDSALKNSHRIRKFAS